MVEAPVGLQEWQRDPIGAPLAFRQIALSAYRDLMDALLERQLSRNRIGLKSVA
jgi:hypothetical protein